MLFRSHQDLPFERLVEELRPGRRTAQNQLVQVMVAVQNVPLGEIALPGLTLAPVAVDFPAARFDLEVFFTEIDGGIAMQITWATDLYDATTVQRLESHFDVLLASVLREPSLPLSEVPLFQEPERHQLQREWNDSDAEIPGEDVPALFAEQARLRPAAVALSSEEGDRKSTRLNSSH